MNKSVTTAVERETRETEWMGISGEDDDVEITHKGGKHGIMMTSEREKNSKKE